MEQLALYSSSILLGIGETLCIALVSLVIGLLFGTALALLYTVKSNWIRFSILMISHLFRGLPEILILFIVYFGGSLLISDLSHQQIEISPFLAGSLTLGFIFGLYASNILHTGLSHISKGELEAASCLGLSSWQTLYRIKIPQIFQYSLPGLGSLWLTLLKDTALVSLIGGSDLMSRMQIAVQNTQQPFTFYLTLACLYLGLTALSEVLLKRIKRHV